VSWPSNPGAFHARVVVLNHLVGRDRTSGVGTLTVVLGKVVRSGFINTYLTFREESAKDNFRIADHLDFDAEM
jgi:hypothetical protein